MYRHHLVVEISWSSYPWFQGNMVNQIITKMQEVLRWADKVDVGMIKITTYPTHKE